MKKTIWKYQLSMWNEEQTLLLPVGAQILTAQLQDDRPCLWALVSEVEELTVPRVFRIIGTGHPMPNAECNYISTFQLAGGSLVFHVFEVL